MRVDADGAFDDVFDGVDIAFDVRGSYLDKVEDGWSAKDADTAVADEFQDAAADTDDGIMAALALAYVESSLGRLTARARTAAEVAASSVVDTGGAPQSAKPSLVARVTRQINGPQPKVRKLRRRATPGTDLTAGTILGYRSKAGIIHLLAVEHIESNRYYSAPVIQLLDYQSEVVPDAAALSNITARPEYQRGWRSTRQKVIEASDGERVDAGFFVVGKASVDAISSEPDVSSNWTTLAGYINHAERHGEVYSDGPSE